MPPEPALAPFEGLSGGVGEDDDVGPAGQARQGLRTALGHRHVGDCVSEEGLEVGLSRFDVDVLVLAGPIDVLEQGEAVEAHLEPLGAQVTGEPLHEEPQDLVHVDDEQGALTLGPEGPEIWRRLFGRGEGHEPVLG